MNAGKSWSWRHTRFSASPYVRDSGIRKIFACEIWNLGLWNPSQSHCDVKLLLSFFSFISSKGFEGSDYKDGTTGKEKADNSVPSGEVFTYSWEVPERAGPGTDGPACSTWAYYSDVNPIKDTNSGLVGPLIVCKKVRNNWLADVLLWFS